jgi:hypothetical protein
MITRGATARGAGTRMTNPGRHEGDEASDERYTHTGDRRLEACGIESWISSSLICRH